MLTFLGRFLFLGLCFVACSAGVVFDFGCVTGGLFLRGVRGGVVGPAIVDWVLRSPAKELK